MYLITGATGFIGKRVTRCLAKSGAKFKIISRKSVQSSDCFVHDFSKSSHIPKKVFNDIDMVFHIAGIAHNVRGGDGTDLEYRRFNVDFTIRLATLAAQNNVNKFVFISSTKAAGVECTKTCCSEMDQGEPNGIYGITKLEAELELFKIGKKYGMHVSIIRPSLVYGPNIKGNLKLMLSAIDKGWFPPLPETGNQRSMIHVDDLVRGILLVAEDERANGEIFIATDGTPYSSREIYNAMCSVVGKPTPRWSVPKVFFDIVSLISPSIKYKVDKLLGNECYSSAKLEALGFKAKKSLKDMNETDF